MQALVFSTLIVIVSCALWRVMSVSSQIVVHHLALAEIQKLLLIHQQRLVALSNLLLLLYCWGKEI